MWTIYKFLSAVFPTHFAADKLTISVSDEYEILLPFTPKSVSVEFDCPNGLQVCGGDSDGFDVQYMPDGFVIDATINSNSRTLTWYASR